MMMLNNNTGDAKGRRATMKGKKRLYSLEMTGTAAVDIKIDSISNHQPERCICILLPTPGS